MCAFIIEFSIGPVQGFVSQSRRTRDLWGSSFLLSLLSGEAIIAAKKAGGDIITPVLDGNKLYKFLKEDNKSSTDDPKEGGIPNHFVVRVKSKDDVEKVANAAKQAFFEKWQKIADKVWDKFISGEPEDLGKGTKDIWKRQVNHFWEFVWVAADEKHIDGVLARRKHWRSHFVPDEYGDKCSVMSDLQELSGYVRANKKDKHDESQDKFWKAVGEKVKKVSELDLRENERLSAIAFIKRMYPYIIQDVFGFKLDVAHWPSVSYIAAVPWLMKSVEFAEDKMLNYYNTAQDRFSSKKHDFYSEKDNVLIDKIAKCLENKVNFSKVRRLFYADARIYSKKYFIDKYKDNNNEIKSKQKNLDDILDKIYKIKANGAKLGSPPSFYAMLLADGDSMGKMISSIASNYKEDPHKGKRLVSEALVKFTKSVTDIVKKHFGVTVYAGGDDVLAMLPVENALDCAKELSEKFVEAFKEISELKNLIDEKKINPTLSVAVVFAHIKYPMMRVLQEAHHLLDDVAKEQNGRDSLAVSILKRGGLQAQWVSTWKRKNGACAVEQMNALVKYLNKFDGKNSKFSSSLLYRLRDNLSLLFDWNNWEYGTVASLDENDLIDDKGLETIVLADILHSIELSGVSVDESKGETKQEKIKNIAEDLTSNVINLLYQSRNKSDDSPKSKEEKKIGFDSLIIARFLASGGQEDHQ